MKKTAFILALIFIVPLLIGTNAGAQTSGWYSCDVGMIGSGGEYVFVELTDSGGKFGKTPFTAYPTRAKEILATAMFAKINSKPVLVNITGTEAYSYIVSIFVN